MTTHHVIAWIDHSEARILSIDPEQIEATIVKPIAHPHLHVKRGVVGSGHAAEDQHYYNSVAEALAGAREILIAGPGQAKLALLKHLHAHHPAIVEHVVGIETSDHPSDRQLVDHARHYFKAKDRML